MTDGYVTDIALDEDDEIIGYKFVNFGKMMDFIKAGDDANTAFEKAKGQYGRVADAVRCTRDHLYRAERGEPRHGFSIDLLIEIAQYFHVSLDYLVLGEAGNNHAVREELIRISMELKMLCGKIR